MTRFDGLFVQQMCIRYPQHADHGCIKVPNGLTIMSEPWDCPECGEMLWDAGTPDGRLIVVQELGYFGLPFYAGIHSGRFCREYRTAQALAAEYERWMGEH